MRTVTLVRHRIRDYNEWRSVYDSVGDLQRDGGVRYQRVMRSADDPNSIVVVHEFDSRESAQAFFDDPGLRDAMARAGVDMSSFELEVLEDLGGGEL